MPPCRIGTLGFALSVIIFSVSSGSFDRAAAQGVTYQIDSDESFIRFVPGVPNGDADSGFIVEEGTRFANTLAVIEQAAGSLESRIGGTLTATVVDLTISFAGGSVMDVLANPVGPFMPGSGDTAEGTGSRAEEDNFGGRGAFIGPENIVASLALRDAVADITSGSATVGGSVQELQFAVTSGILDFSLDTFDSLGFLDLPEILAPVSNQSTEPLTGSLDGTIRIPLALDFTLDIFAPGDSRLVVEGQIVATRTPQVIAGDYNASGTVEQGDLDLVLLNWGTDAGMPPAGWIAHLPAGTVDQGELDGVLLNWGATSTGVRSSTVPEPSTMILVVCGGIGALIAITGIHRFL